MYVSPKRNVTERKKNKGNDNRSEPVAGKNFSPRPLSVTVEQDQAGLGNHLVCLETMSTEVHNAAFY